MSNTNFARTRAALILAALFTGASGAAGAAGAAAAPSAHTPRLLAQRPAPTARLAHPPTRIALRFDRPIKLTLAAIAVTDGRGTPVAISRPFHPGGVPAKVAVHLRGRIGPGIYLVNYRPLGATRFEVLRAPGIRAAPKRGGLGLLDIASGALVALTIGLAGIALLLAARSRAHPESGAATGSPAPRAQRFGQIALGLIWLTDGALQLQPFMFHESLVTQIIAPSAAGQPELVAHSVTLVAGWIRPVLGPFNATAALIQLGIGAGLLRARRVRLALLVSFAWSLAVWWLGEGYGMLLTGAASPLTGAPGAVALYALAGLMVWPRAAGGDSAAGSGLLGERGARWAWSGLWLLFAVLWVLPANRAAQSIHDAIAAAPSGIGGLGSLEHALAAAADGRGESIAVAAAVTSVAIAAASQFGRSRRPALVASIAIACAFWVAQGLGGVFTGSGTDPNSGPLIALIALLVMPLTGRGSGSGRGGPRVVGWLRAGRGVPTGAAAAALR